MTPTEQALLERVNILEGELRDLKMRQQCQRPRVLLVFEHDDWCTAFYDNDVRVAAIHLPKGAVQDGKDCEKWQWAVRKAPMYFRSVVSDPGVKYNGWTTKTLGNLEFEAVQTREDLLRLAKGMNECTTQSA